MARKSRKHPTPKPTIQSSRDTVGYIRLSAPDEDASGSIRTQQLIIEKWGLQNQTPILHYYIDNGYSGKRFDRPAFQEMIQDVLAGEIECIAVKDLSRLGRDHIAIGYYLEILFPANHVRFVSVNDQFDTVDGMTNQNKEIPLQSSTRIPLINLLNEQVSIETKMKVEAILDMKAQHGEFIGPRAPFGYQKSSENPNQLIPDPIAAITVRKIFELSANGEGVTAIVRYLNERGLPTPIQYARSNGLTGNFNDGNGNWNSRTVKYILTNRTYTGMLIQGKEKRVVEATHEPLVNAETFDAIQKSFQDRAYNIAPVGQSTENILKGKVICGCCGGKMQRKRGTNHAGWYFFTCNTNNRLGIGKCTGMYVREEDLLNALYRQLKLYVNEHFISDLQYKQRMHELDAQISYATQLREEAIENSRQQYERYIEGAITREELRMALDALGEVREAFFAVIENKEAYEKQYQAFRKLLLASCKDIPLSEITGCIDKIVVDGGKHFEVKWIISKNQDK